VDWLLHELGDDRYTKDKCHPLVDQQDDYPIFYRIMFLALPKTLIFDLLA